MSVSREKFKVVEQGNSSYVVEIDGEFYDEYPEREGADLCVNFWVGKLEAYALSRESSELSTLRAQLTDAEQSIAELNLGIGKLQQQWNTERIRAEAAEAKNAELEARCAAQEKR